MRLASGLLQDAAKWIFFPRGGGSAPVSGPGSGLVSVGLMEVVG